MLSGGKHIASAHYRIPTITAPSSSTPHWPFSSLRAIKDQSKPILVKPISVFVTLEIDWMKITALLVLKCNPDGSSDPVILANASDVSHFGYFQRSSVREFIVFVGRTVGKRTPPNQRQSVQHEEYKVHSYNRNGLCAVGFMDDHYPVRSSFSLLNQVLDEYQKNFGDSWRAVKVDNTQLWPYLNEALAKFQDPAEADKLLKIQRELDETKIILDSLIAADAFFFFFFFFPFDQLIVVDDVANANHKTIDSVLARGERLDSLVDKSSDLSAASQPVKCKGPNWNTLSIECHNHLGPLGYGYVNICRINNKCSTNRRRKPINVVQYCEHPKREENQSMLYDIVSIRSVGAIPWWHLLVML
ncbi:hypothetical protein RHSIM_Rhsim03G0256000 [Rhododendron simsii]|uniref:Longin domain-containing protein n=1 Tax=Rhododendron simsii TaxID=118357 RepID=A0A834LSF6_RHOSS|nr:hypothetical protein RHSIM_Rhsim03G0256000 [Rhododendron simsii]